MDERALEGPDLWREQHVPYGLFLSDALWAAVTDAKLRVHAVNWFTGTVEPRPSA